jgi:lipoprotein-anchoring transpeptidase ErfK/SrfK
MSIRKVLAAGLVSALVLPLLTATTQAAQWSIERMSGNVQIHDGESWVKLDQDRELKAGDSIWTGRNGRILLKNDQGSVLLAPKSLVKIPAQALPSNFSVLFQTHGKVSAEVDKRRKRHFSIQTPDLVAVVKGADFDVEIEKKQTRVAVSEGLVGVVDIDTGEQIDVVAGGVRAAVGRAPATTRKSAALRVPSLPRSTPQRLRQTMSIAPSAVGRVEPEKMPPEPEAPVEITAVPKHPAIAEAVTVEPTPARPVAALQGERFDPADGRDQVAEAHAASQLVAKVDISQQTMSVIKNGRVIRQWPVSTGRKRYRTPVGSYRPSRMHVYWESRKYNRSPMPHSIFFQGGYAIHGTNEVRNLGRVASHGCIRLHPANAKELFYLVKANGRSNTRIVVQR